MQFMVYDEPQELPVRDHTGLLRLTSSFALVHATREPWFQLPRKHVPVGFGWLFEVRLGVIRVPVCARAPWVTGGFLSFLGGISYQIRNPVVS